MGKRLDMNRELLLFVCESHLQARWRCCCNSEEADVCVRQSHKPLPVMLPLYISPEISTMCDVSKRWCFVDAYVCLCLRMWQNVLRRK